MANTIQFKRGGTAPGSLAAGEIAIDTTNQKLYYGNASAQVTEAGGSSAIEASFTADGAISAGDPVGIQASGKVKTIGPGYNTRDVGIGKDSNFAISVFVPTVNRFVVAYRDDENGDDYILRVVKVADGVVTLGAENDQGGVLSTGGSALCYDPDTDRVLIAGAFTSGSNVRVAVGTVTGGTTNTIAVGTSTTCDSGSSASGVSLCYDPIQKKALVTYRKSSTLFSQTVNVTGGTTNTVSLGTAQKVSDDNPHSDRRCAAVYDVNSNYIFHAYETSSGEDVKVSMARIGEASGTDDKIDESNSQLTLAGNAEMVGMAYNPDDGGPLVVYVDEDDDNKIKGRFVFARETGTETGALQGDPLMSEPLTLTDTSTQNSKIMDGRHGSIAYNPILKSYVLSYVNNQHTELGADPSGFPPPDQGTVEYVFIKSNGKASIKTSRFPQRVINYKDDDDASEEYHESGNTEIMCNTVNGDTLLTYLDLDQENRYFLAASPEDSNHYKYIGIAQSSVSDGASVTVSLQGQAVTNQKGHTLGFGDLVNAGTPNDDFQGSYGSVVYDPDADRYVIAYQDAGNNDYPTAIVCQLSGLGITKGTPVVIESASISGCPIGLTYDTSVDRVVAVYMDGGNSNAWTSAVGTVTSGTNAISWGTPQEVDSGAQLTNSVGIIFDPDTSRVVTAGCNNADVRAYVGNVTGGTTNSISWGSTNQVDSGARQNVGLTYDTNVDRIVVQWTDSGNSYYGTAIVGTVTGGTTNSISFGSDSVYESANSYTSNNNEGIAFDSNTNKIVIAWKGTQGSLGAGDANPINAIVGTVTGGTSNSISWGTKNTFAYNARSEDLGIHFDSLSNRFIGKYVNNREPYALTFFSLEVSGTSIIQRGFPHFVVSGEQGNYYTTMGINPTNGKAVFFYREANNDGGEKTTKISFASLNTLPGKKYYLQPSGLAVADAGGYQQDEHIRYGTGYTDSGGMIVG